MLAFVTLLLIFFAVIYFFIRTKPFGTNPKGEDLKTIHDSSNFRNGQFQNLSKTPSLTEGAGFFGVLREFLFDKDKRNKPAAALPSQKTDLLHLAPDRNLLVWFGHSSYFIQTEGKTILVDPVFSGNASPLSFTTRSFDGTDIYTVDDIPTIDYLFISHDHWDHLDYKTVLGLKSKVKKLITGLGTAAHLEHWGYDRTKMEIKDWNESIQLDNGFTVLTTPARHFSGRGLKRNGSLWMSFVLSTPVRKIFIGGDSGYDQHFREIGLAYGPFDLAILEDGQYNKNWKYIHMNPEETVQAAIDLRAKRLLPVHWGKFSLSLHAWDEPIIRIKKEAALRNMNLVHPKIGEAVDLDQEESFDTWWEGID
jgi:L-ascorbate metabolism protein UlaG (beta-lactamase superfamily)